MDERDLYKTKQVIKKDLKVVEIKIQKLRAKRKKLRASLGFTCCADVGKECISTLCVICGTIRPSDEDIIRMWKHGLSGNAKEPEEPLEES